MYIDAIETLCQELEKALAIERIKIYTSIKQLIDDVRSYVNENKEEGNVIDCNSSNIYFAELLSHVMPISGLEENNHPEEQRFLWIQTSINKLRSVRCFDL